MEKVKNIIEKIEKGISVSEIARQEKVNRHSISLVKQCYEYMLQKEKNHTKIDEVNTINTDEKDKKIEELKKTIEKIKADCHKAIENEKSKIAKIKSEVEKEKLTNFIMGVIAGAIITMIIIAVIIKLKGG